jgi:uncharacterized protein YqgC (DUF456 family)
VSPAAELLVLLVMVAGLVGVVVPVLPGLVLIWAAGVGWAWVGGGAVRWAVAGVLTVLLVAGAVGALVGFFVIPVVGVVVGGVGAVYLAERSRLGAHRSAWRSTRAVLIGVGIGLLVELATGVVMIGVWGAAAIAT